MHKPPIFRWFFCSLVALLTTAGAHGQAFRSLGFLKPNDPSAYSRAYGISGNGLVVVGNSGAEAFRWTVAEGMKRLGIPGQSVALAASWDGSGIVGMPGQPTARPT